MIFNWTDLAVLIFLIVIIIQGMQRGLFREILGLAALMVAYMLAAWQYKMLALSLMPIIRLSEKTVQIIGFSIIWLVSYSALEMVASVFKGILPKFPADPAMGMLLGLIRGLTFIALILLLVIVLPLPEKTAEHIRGSISVKWIYPAVNSIYNLSSNLVPAGVPKAKELFDYAQKTLQPKPSPKIKTF